MGPNGIRPPYWLPENQFQSSVRINVGPNVAKAQLSRVVEQFQSSVRINVGPNLIVWCRQHHRADVSILRED